jgi:hypothetical protein
MPDRFWWEMIKDSVHVSIAIVEKWKEWFLLDAVCIQTKTLDCTTQCDGHKIVAGICKLLLSIFHKMNCLRIVEVCLCYVITLLHYQLV